NVKLGDTVNFADGSNTTATYDATTNTYKYNLNNDINLNSVNAGGTVVNSTGVQAGAIKLDAASGKITGVTAGSNATDAVNVEQLNKAQAAATTKVNAGNNINVQSTLNADGSTSYTVATNKEVNFDKVTVGGVVIDKTTNKISGLADGVVNGSSSEAINGSQLNNSTNSISEIIGGGVTNNAGNLSGPFSTNGNNYNTIADAIAGESAAAKTEVKNNDGNITVSSSTGTDGQSIYTVGLADQLAIGSQVSIDGTTGDINAGSIRVNGTTGNVNGLSNTTWDGSSIVSGQAATEDQLQQVANAASSASSAAKTEVKEGKNINVLESVGANGQSIYTIATADDVNFATISVGDNTSGIKLDGSSNKISNLAAGEVSSTSSEAINGSQLYTLGNNVTNLFGGNAEYINQQINWTNIGGTGKNTIDDAIASVKNSADNASQGWNISTNGGTASNVKPGNTVDFKGDGSVVVSNEGNKVTVGLSDKVTVGSGNNAVSIDGNAGTIQVGEVSIDGSTGNITAGKVNIDGVNGTVNGLTNTTWDPDKIISGQAATEDQLKQVANDATSAAAKAKTTVSAGNNVVVTKTQNTDGSDNYQVATSKDVTFDSVTSDKVTAGTVTADKVTVGSVNIDSSGINAGNQKITNVAAGTVSATSTDAVNGSQLYGHTQAVQNIIGGSTSYDVTTGAYTNNNIGGTGQNTIDAAIGVVNNNINTLGQTLNRRIDNLEDDLSAGIAATAALEAAPYVPGKWTYAAGASYYNDQSAVGATLRRTADNGRWSLTGGVAGGTNGSALVRVGISGVID
ncbi:hypothetical protein F4V57_14310, partial [Acinetobacter qingfengensis]|uniref:YadA-like family protein n=1 Tax=Acinetobacter qingfengensis TaxID=1262585 RepID=UPI00127BB041